MIRKHNPSTVPAPLGGYAHGIEVAPGARWLHISGQVGMRADGSVPSEAAAQLKIAWDNISHILSDADMTMRDIVKVSTYIVRAEDFAAQSAARREYLDDHTPAATTVVVIGLAKPELLIEIDVVAATR